MRGKPLKMHHIREVLRLAATGTSNRMISGCLGIARSTVADVLGRAAEAGLAWPLAPEMGDAELAQALYQRPARSPHLGARRHAEPRRSGCGPDGATSTANFQWQSSR